MLIIPTTRTPGRNSAIIDAKIDHLPELLNAPTDIGGRVLLNYGPLLRVAQLVGDESFIQDLSEKLLLDQAELEYAQQSEPALLILQSIIAGMYNDKGDEWPSSLLLSSLRNLIRDESGCFIASRQIGAMLRRMGFVVKNSHGQLKVFLNSVTLLKACEEYGYQGEDVDELKKRVKEAAGGR